MNPSNKDKQDLFQVMYFPNKEEEQNMKRKTRKKTPSEIDKKQIELEFSWQLNKDGPKETPSQFHRYEEFISELNKNKRKYKARKNKSTSHLESKSITRPSQIKPNPEYNIGEKRKKIETIIGATNNFDQTAINNQPNDTNKSEVFGEYLRLKKSKSTAIDCTSYNNLSINDQLTIKNNSKFVEENYPHSHTYPNFVINKYNLNNDTNNSNNIINHNIINNNNNTSDHIKINNINNISSYINNNNNNNILHTPTSNNFPEKIVNNQIKMVDNVVIQEDYNNNNHQMQITSQPPEELQYCYLNKYNINNNNNMNNNHINNNHIINNNINNSINNNHINNINDSDNKNISVNNNIINNNSDNNLNELEPQNKSYKSRLSLMKVDNLINPSNE